MYLLDTNHASRALEGDPQVLAAISARGDVSVAINVIVRAELVYMAHHSERHEDNLARVHRFLAGLKILPIDDATADRYGALKADLLSHFGPRERSARRRYDMRSLGVSENDLWIAASALRHGLVLVSSDSDFTRTAEICPLSVETWRGPAGQG